MKWKSAWKQKNWVGLKGSKVQEVGLLNLWKGTIFVKDKTHCLIESLHLIFFITNDILSILLQIIRK